MDVKIRGNQGKALQCNKDVEHDVDIEDNDTEYYNNIKDYGEIKIT